MSERTSEIAKALAAFHKDLPEVHKGSTNPAFKSKYADLADIVKVVLPKLAAQGLAWITTPTYVDEQFVLAYELRHTSGESLGGVWPLPDPGKATPQQLGSAVTYAKRYTLSAVTGIAPDEDDDGNGASADTAPRAGNRQARPKIDPTMIAQAATAIAGAADVAALNSLEDLAKQRGIAGVAEVRSAIEAKRAELGPINVEDAWAAVPVAEVQK